MKSRDLNEDSSNGFIENSTESKCLPILSRISYETDMMIWRVQRRIRVAEVRWDEGSQDTDVCDWWRGDEALLIIIHTVSRPLDPRAVGLTVRRQSKFTPLHLLLQPLIALNSLYSWSRFFVSLRSDLNLIIWFLVVLKYPFLLCNAFINFFSLAKRFFAQYVRRFSLPLIPCFYYFLCLIVQFDFCLLLSLNNHVHF